MSGIILSVAFQCGDCGAINNEEHEPWCPGAGIGDNDE